MVENIGRWGNEFNASEKGREAKLRDRQVERERESLYAYCLSPGCLSSLASGVVSGRCMDGCDGPREPAQ